jgi:hypothetical protein
VNRIDLHHNLTFGPGLAGELRFVFQILNTDRRYPSDSNPATADGTCLTLTTPFDASFPFGEFTVDNGLQFVILEYAVMKRNDDEVRAYAGQWAALQNMELGSTAYLGALEKITEAIVKRGASGGKLIRIRTNDTPDAIRWHMREFDYVNDSSGRRLVPVTVKQTPKEHFNESADLAQWAKQNEWPILLGQYVVPNTLPADGVYTQRYFLGARSIANLDSTGFWRFDADIEATPHVFSLNTCNGCHLGETGTFIAHAQGRRYGVRTELSGFLTGKEFNGRFFNDLDARNTVMSDLLNGTSLSMLSFQPSGRTH